MGIIDQIKNTLRPLNDSLEKEYWDHQLLVISTGLKVAIYIASFLLWALAIVIWHITKDTEMRGLFAITLGLQIWLLFNYQVLDTNGRLRHILAYLTAAGPCAAIYFMFKYALPNLPFESMLQAQFIPIIFVLLFYAFETLSISIAISSGLFTSLIILFLRLNDPIATKASSRPLVIALLITNTIGILMTIHSCYTSRMQFKLARALEKEKEVLNSLIQRVFPETIGQELRSKRSNLARSYRNVTLLIADIANFTKITTSMEPKQLVTLLHELFHRFDHLAGLHGVEKIKTIGDAYMAAAGCPDAVKDHAERIAQFSLELLKAIQVFNEDFGTEFQIRIGIHSGPVVGGVISGKRISFDIWGETVNLASRLENIAEPGEIIISEDAAKILRRGFTVSANRLVELKGIGPTPVSRLLASHEKNPYLSGRSAHGSSLDAGELPFLSQH